MKNFISQVLKDSKGKYSSKRIVLITSLIAYLTTITLDVFLGIAIGSYVHEELIWIIITCIVSNSLEHFANRHKEKR